jgi:Putative phage metallopeptidase
MQSLLVPMPPSSLLESDELEFLPAPEFGNWAFSAFISGESPLCNVDHVHLREATIGFLWTNASNQTQGKRVVGTAQCGQASGKPWPKAMRNQQVREWFGEIPDFLITLDAEYLSEGNNILDSVKKRREMRQVKRH